jgi:hypothetical protein
LYDPPFLPGHSTKIRLKELKLKSSIQNAGNRSQAPQWGLQRVSSSREVTVILCLILLIVKMDRQKIELRGSKKRNDDIVL